jgi:3-deoxy-D-manno-octulosonic-acid transferase
MLVERQALRIVHDAGELAAAVGSLLADPNARAIMGAAGKKVVDDNRGAVARLMQFLEPLLPS